MRMLKASGEALLPTVTNTVCNAGHRIPAELYAQSGGKAGGNRSIVFYLQPMKVQIY